MAIKTFANESAAVSYIQKQFEREFYYDDEYGDFKTDVQDFKDGNTSYGSGYTYGYSVPQVTYNEFGPADTVNVTNDSFGIEYANWANGWGYYSGARNGPHKYWGKDTGELIDKFKSEGIELTYLQDIIELNGPEAKDYEAINPATGEGLVIPVGTTVDGLSFGSKLTE